MDSKSIRKKFLEFFQSKSHHIVPSAPMVVKNDPTLMFTNAGMNQFKDIFLGNSIKQYDRIANSQKCLRVSGKHNDLEEVGHDTYHHTMFEMLGNWSFGDYFKKEAIDWAWEFLVEVLKVDKNRMYATIFEGDAADNIDKDNEAYGFWKQYLPESRILNGNKKDNFWEMGDTGPCGPCSEIHVDLRDDDEREKIDGKELVNKDHPLVIEIWNLVFIQYNRKANGDLVALPHKHVDTGMGFERLCMVMQAKKSNYDTDVFQPIIQEISKLSNIDYGVSQETDVAMRVIADHLRAVSFSIADGQLPSNNKAGYVIRRILRRAVRYTYTFLKQDKPFIYRLIPVLIEVMGEAFPELVSQQGIIEKVIQEEENSFLRTLETGIRLLDQVIARTKEQDYNTIPGADAFELYDTFGFPLDLTELIVRENGLVVNRREFDNEMEKQKNRSRSAAAVDTDDWVEIRKDDVEEFVGYDYLSTKVKIVRYRKIKQKDKSYFQLVFNVSPFYAESGGQVGDSGYIQANGKKIAIIDTVKENNLSVHIVNELPENPELEFEAVVNSRIRTNTANNHTATHLLHYALRRVLGDHVEQKGSLVNSDYLRFDFSHFQKLSDEEIRKIEAIVNDLIRKNIPLEEKRNVPISEAENMGAMALFGEKYGDTVRVIKFGDSVELCGGTHVAATGQIGYFHIQAETAIAAGIRRIEAISGEKVEQIVSSEISTLQTIREMLKTKDPIKSIEKLMEDNARLQKQIDGFAKNMAKALKADILKKVEEINGVKVISGVYDIDSPQTAKDIAFQLKGEVDNLFFVIGGKANDMPSLTIMISDNLVKEKGLHAGNIIREVAKEIKGGGGGQPFFATAGGKDVSGLDKAVQLAVDKIRSL